MVLVIVVFDGQGWSAPVRDATASCVAYPVVGFDRLCFFFALLHLTQPINWRVINVLHLIDSDYGEYRPV